MPGILLVDDEKNVLTTLGIGLRRAGYNVFEAGSGPRALELMETEDVDIVLSDIRMAPMDGYTLAAEVKKHSPDTKVILMSAYDVDDEKEQSVRQFISCRLVKPFQVQKLVDVLERELEDSCKVLLVSNESDSEDIKHNLESDGFHCSTCTNYSELYELIDTESCDLLLIDGEYLNGDGWKVLNEIDQKLPGKPVVILTGNKGRNAIHTGENLAYTMLDRVSFFKDTAWGVKMLKSIVGDA